MCFLWIKWATFWSSEHKRCLLDLGVSGWDFVTGLFTSVFPSDIYFCLIFSLLFMHNTYLGNWIYDSKFLQNCQTSKSFLVISTLKLKCSPWSILENQGFSRYILRYILEDSLKLNDWPRPCLDKMRFFKDYQCILQKIFND